MKADKIRSNFVFKDIRFNAGYFLNEDALNSRIIERNHSKCQLLEELAEAWNPPIFKRQFCSESERAVPYCQSSDVSNALEGSEVFINKKQAIKVGSIVEEKQILVTGFGTIGNTRLVNELSNGISYANNVCRIKVKDFIPYGYVYAFMTSKYGKSQLNKNASGSVVRYIEAPGIKKTLIPILPGETQQKIHNLIVESAQLRVEANKLLREAVVIFEKEIGESKVTHSFQVGKISSNKIYGFHKRFDSQYQLGWNALDKEKKNNLEYTKLAQVACNIFVGGRGKRNYVENGIPFLSSSDMMLFNPKRNSKKISTSTQGIVNMKVSLYDILISRSGTVGNTVIVGKDLQGTVISEHALRLVVNPEKISPLYVFTFLKTKYGLKTMESSSFGSVIITLNEDLIGNIEMPILEERLQSEIEKRTEKYISNLDQSTELENQAIDLIEKEIDQWQQ